MGKRKYVNHRAVAQALMNQLDHIVNMEAELLEAIRVATMHSAVGKGLMFGVTGEELKSLLNNYRILKESYHEQFNKE